jgi:hypothetical protein
MLQFDLVGVTDNTFVGSGDPCSTGLSGGNACNNQVMNVSLLIDTSNTAADSLPADPADGYYGAIAAPGFITGSATINGNVFSIPGTFMFNFSQVIEIRNDYYGYDQVIVGVDGGNMSARFSLGATFNQTNNPFSSDSLAELDDLAGLALLNNRAIGTFNFTGATGEVQGNVVFNQAAFSAAAVPAPAAGWLIAPGIAAVLHFRRKR